MTIWVDADACPKTVREILFRAAERVGVAVVLVANQTIDVPGSRHIRAIRVAPGFDMADNEIVKRLLAGDLVVTADIPLAAQVVARGGQALDPRGELYTENNIRERLNLRDFMETLRSSGIAAGGPPALGPRERQAFANALDTWLARQTKPPT